MKSSKTSSQEGPMKTNWYRANAIAFGGDFTSPLRTVIAPQAVLSLAPTGGHQTSRLENYKLNGLLSVRAAHTEVAGSFDEVHQIRTSYAASVIEGLNIAGVVTADRVVSRLVCHTPIVGGKEGASKFSIIGSRFEDLRIAGHRIEVQLAIQRLDDYDTFAKLRNARWDGKDADLIPWSKSSQTELRGLEQLEKKYKRLKDFSDHVRRFILRKKDVEDEDPYLYSAAGSLKLSGQSQLKNFGGIVFVPNFGVIRLAEVLIEKSVRKLAMIRVDMGSPPTGYVDVGSTDAGRAVAPQVEVYEEQQLSAEGSEEGKRSKSSKKKRPLKKIVRNAEEKIPDERHDDYWAERYQRTEDEVAYRYQGPRADYGPGDELKKQQERMEALYREVVLREKREAPPEPAFTTVRATPQLEIKKELAPGTAYRMAVFVDQGPSAEGADVQPLEIRLPVDLPEIPVQVWLDCSSHFTLEDLDAPDVIKIERKTGTSNEFGFTLKVIKSSDDGRPMSVSAFFRYEGRPCGRITRYLELVNGALGWKKFVPPVKVEAEVFLPRANAPAAVVIEPGAKPADIRVEVMHAEANDGRQFKMRCFTPQENTDDWIPWNLPGIAPVFVKAALQRFIEAASPAARFDGLRGAGIVFWTALPAKVQGLLWDAIEKGAVTMSVVSQEPVIPWELMVPQKKGNPDREPLGVGLRLGRWITGDYKAAPQTIRLKTGYIIAPKDSRLENAPAELKFLTQELKPRLEPADEVLPASYDGVNQALSGPARDVIHFICHGTSAEFIQILELDKPDTIDSNMVRSADAFKNAFKKAPLAFLNACEVGGQVLSLDGVGGFANSFIDLGASAVIAPLWAVDDKAAYDVTRTFYAQALDGVPFAEIMKQIRAKAYDRSTAIDSYAAYCFYGDPMAKAISKPASSSHPSADPPAGST